MVRKSPKRIPPIGGYYGGKAKPAPWIVSHFRPHHSYRSPFAGFASPAIEKERSPVEILSDLNPATVAALLDIQGNVGELINWLSHVQFNRELFAQCKEAIAQGTHPYLGYFAIAYSAMACQRGGAQSGFAQQQCDRAVRRDWSYLEKVSKRLWGMEILHQDFRVALEGVNEGLVFLDPPYLKGGEHYHVRMSVEEHVELLDWCKTTRADVVLCGYESALYNHHLKGWRKEYRVARNSSRNERTEVLWINY